MQIEEIEEVEEEIEEIEEEIEEKKEEIKDLRKEIDVAEGEGEIEEIEAEIDELEQDIEELEEKMEMLEELLELGPIYIGDAHKSVAILKENGESIGGKKMLEVTDFLAETEIVYKEKNIKHKGKTMDFIVLKNMRTETIVKVWAKYRGYGNHIEAEKYTIRKCPWHPRGK